MGVGEILATGVGIITGETIGVGVTVSVTVSSGSPHPDRKAIEHKQMLR
jgi:hypothetical protein